MKVIKFSTAAGLLLAFIGPASAQAISCNSGDQANWQPKDALTKKLSAQGWDINFIKPANGCWRVFARTPDGQRSEAYFDPLSGEKLLVTQFGKIVFKRK